MGAENKDKYTDPERNEEYKNLSITARCAGTDMSGGAIGESIIMDFSRYMNKLVDLSRKKILLLFSRNVLSRF